jgi:uncharacterized protein YjbI with pentapeptide repeats
LCRFQEDAVDAERFDRLVESLTRSGTRRGVVRTLSGAVLGAVGFGALAEPGAAGRDQGGSKRRGNGKGKNRKGKKGVRAQGAGCCSGGNCTPGAGKNLAKCCYEDQNLAGKTFKGANLGSANFTGATLTNADFRSANLDKTCLVDADLTGARLAGANTGTAIFCRTQTSQGVNNSGCGKGTACCDTCNRAIGEICTGSGDVCCDGATCCDDGCRDLSSDENNCGACGNVCEPGLTCCGGECVDLDTDLNNCTACGNVCPATLPNADVFCGLGKNDQGEDERGCVFLCGADFRDCNDDPVDGCETQIRNNNFHCGTCSDTDCAANGEECKGCRCVPPVGLSTICQPVSSARLIRRR